jgi:hypothetical protein
VHPRQGQYGEQQRLVVERHDDPLAGRDVVRSMSLSSRASARSMTTAAECDVAVTIAMPRFQESWRKLWELY